METPESADQEQPITAGSDDIAREVADAWSIFRQRTADDFAAVSLTKIWAGIRYRSTLHDEPTRRIGWKVETVLSRDEQEDVSAADAVGRLNT